MSHDWLMMTLERRHDLITVLKPYFLPKRLHSTKSYFIKAIDHTFYGFTGVITHLGCWENTRKACKSLAFGSWFTSFSRVLPTSRVGYYAGKPIESVVYCLTNPDRNSNFAHWRCVKLRFVYVVVIAACQTIWCNRPLLSKTLEKRNHNRPEPRF